MELHTPLFPRLFHRFTRIFFTKPYTATEEAVQQLKEIISALEIEMAAALNVESNLRLKSAAANPLGRGNSIALKRWYNTNKEKELWQNHGTYHHQLKPFLKQSLSKYHPEESETTDTLTLWMCSHIKKTYTKMQHKARLKGYEISLITERRISTPNFYVAYFHVQKI